MAKKRKEKRKRKKNLTIHENRWMDKLADRLADNQMKADRTIFESMLVNNDT